MPLAIRVLGAALCALRSALCALHSALCSGDKGHGGTYQKREDAEGKETQGRARKPQLDKMLWVAAADGTFPSLPLSFLEAFGGVR